MYSVQFAAMDITFKFISLCNIYFQFRLELLPGFATAIQQYERQIMLCTEVQHKILRTETVLDLLDDLHRRNPRSFTDAAVKALVGEIVLTKYALN